MTRSNRAMPSGSPTILTLTLDGITIDPSVQVRADISTSTVGEYRDAMKTGAVFPPVLVAPIDDGDPSRGYVLLDGHHRYHATKALGLDAINAEVLFGVPVAQWRWVGVQRNQKHGLRYTRTERREQFRAYIQAGKHHVGKYGIKSSRQMAKELGGIVGDRRLPEWMKQDFPSIYRKMVERKMIENSTAYFGKKDMDERLAKIAATNLDQFMAAFRGIRDDDLREAVALEIMGVAQKAVKAGRGRIKLPPVEVPDEF